MVAQMSETYPLKHLRNSNYVYCSTTYFNVGIMHKIIDNILVVLSRTVSDGKQYLNNIAIVCVLK